MILPITTIAAAILCFLYILISFQVIKFRRAHQIGIGDGGNIQLTRLMRVHSNFSEYVPMALMLFLLSEIQGLHSLFLALVATFFVIGRCVHAYGVSQPKENLLFRVRGMQATFLSMVVLSINLIGNILCHIFL